MRGQEDGPMGREGEHRDVIGQRRPLSPEEREAMKRELKAQLRAYVDALKEEMLGRKDGVRPDLEQAMVRAEKEAARRMAQAISAGRQRAPTKERTERTDAGAQRRAGASGGVLAAIAAAGKKADGTKTMNEMTKDTQQQQRNPAAGSEGGEGEASRDVLSVASATQQDEKPSSAKERQQQVSDGDDERGCVQDDRIAETEAKASAISKAELDRLTRDIIAALKTVYDPEIPVDIYELGLVYRIDISDDRVVTIDMTLTAPGCPVAGDMPGWVQKAVSEVEGVKEVKVNLVFDPPWDMSRMSDEARLALNMF